MVKQYFPILMMESAQSSEQSVTIYQPTGDIFYKKVIIYIHRYIDETLRYVSVPCQLQQVHGITDRGST
jgi:hypothetical protein